MRRLHSDGPGNAVRERYLVRGTIAPRFVDAHAVTAADAIAFAPGDAREAKAFAAMIADGSIRMPQAGRFYFDMDAYEEAAAARRSKRVPVLAIVAVLIAVVAVTFYRS